MEVSALTNGAAVDRLFVQNENDSPRNIISKTDCKSKCNWQCYLDRYGDLRKLYGDNNTELAAAHWRTYGEKEGRNCTCVNERECSFNKCENDSGETVSLVKSDSRGYINIAMKMKNVNYRCGCNFVDGPKHGLCSWNQGR